MKRRRRNSINDLTDFEKNTLSNITLTSAEISSILNISIPTVGRLLRKLGIPCKKSGRKPGDGPVHTGTYQPCPVCKIAVYHTKSMIDINRIKCCSRACLMKHEPYIEKHKAIDRSYLLPFISGSNAANWNPHRKEYKRYACRVHGLSNKNYKLNIDIINPNNYPRTICGIDGGWQLDHIIPIKECFELGIPIEEASDISNLRMLPWRENLMRNYGYNI